jgi:hypothetical protein
VSDREASGLFAHIFFMDGVGLGDDDPAVNPFAAARLPRLDALLGPGWWSRGAGPRRTERLSLVPTDATLGIDGRPQSATGQASILTGTNVPRLIGEHYGPKPNPAVAEIIHAGSLFSEVVAAGRPAALLTPYPERFFEAIDSGRRLLSAVPLAAASAGLPLMGADDLRAGRAVSPDFTAQGWRDHLGYADVPLLTLDEAGRRIAALAAGHAFSFFEHWPTDQAGHRGSMEEAVAHVEVLDTVLGALIEAWDDEAGLLIITSDHGNLEEKNHRQHTRNPVPAVFVGPDHAGRAARTRSLVDLAGAVRAHLRLPIPANGLQSGSEVSDYVD